MVSKDNLSVTKRNGRGKESLNIEKIHSMVGFATENITGVSASLPRPFRFRTNKLSCETIEVKPFSSY